MRLLIPFAEKSSPFLARVLAVGVLLLGWVSTSRADLTTGLVAYYPFDGNASDMSGNGNHGTNNGATPGEGRLGLAGKGFNFDGNNDQIDLGNLNFGHPIADYAYSFWMRHESVPAGEYASHVINKPHNFGSGAIEDYMFAFYLFGTSSSSLTGVARHFGTINGVWGSADSGQEPFYRPPVNTWHHYAISYDGSLLVYYVDGAFNTSAAKTGNARLNPGSILAGGSWGGIYFDGDLDELRFYDRALSAPDVLALYNLEKPNQPPSFTGGATFTTAENNASSSFLVGATDPDANTTLVYSKSGPDTDKFTLNVATGEFTFANPPDYEANASAAGNNAYAVTITVTDGEANATQVVTFASPFSVITGNVVPGVYVLTYVFTDAAGNAAATVTRTVTVVDDPPSDLLLSSNSVEENLAAGAEVGRFSVIDSNVEAGIQSYVYLLLEGTENFEIEANGTLRTKQVLDFESIDTYGLKVRTTDVNGGVFEKTFEIKVNDAFVPIVETFAPRDGATDGTFILSGEVLDEGGISGSDSRGVVLGLRPDPVLEGEGATVLDAGSGLGSFEATPRNLLAGKKYYYRAFASNAEGVAYGTQERFTAAEEPRGPAWAGALASAQADGWWTSPWFGHFFLSGNGWVRHESLGWLYAVDDGSGGVWLWQENLGWLWTGEGSFPYLYVNASGGWHYFLGDVSGRVFLYRFSDNEWVDVAEGEDRE